MHETAKLILASGSPRRRAFMQSVGVPVELRPIDLDETPFAGEAPLAFARRMAAEKALAGAEPDRWSLGSDTVVTVDGRILGKPADADEARQMIGDLAGRTHQVITAWALARAGDVYVNESVTGVRFRSLTPAEIDAYIATGDPFDKAGAYGIQSGAGPFVAGIDGSYDGVVGLPIQAVCEGLQARGIATFPHGIALRAAQVREAIATASIGRIPPTLVAVSKGQPIEKLREALRIGLVPLGESYVQEWKAKIEAFGAHQPAWHFIGRVQRNKARFIGAHADLVHAVDALRTGEALARGARDAGRVLPVLVQVNAAGEAAKGGVPPAEVEALVIALNAVEGLTVQGLMTIPPRGAAARPHFATIRALADTLNLPTQSMGMSADFADAIAEGATHVRVGTALFGPRGT